MFAAHYELDNLVAIVDNNNLQIDGDVRDVAGLDGISSKLQSFGWQTIEVDGHDVSAVITALKDGDASRRVARLHRCPYRQGQGRLVHGKPGRLARQGSQ